MDSKVSFFKRREKEEIWKKNFRESLRTTKELSHFFNIPISNIPEKYPVFIPLRLAKIIKTMGLDSPLGRQFLPAPDEINEREGLIDPIGDQLNQKENRLIHRYPTKALFLPTNVCPVICRYCFRKNELYEPTTFKKTEFEKIEKYLTAHPGINEIIFTGGDPMILDTNILEKYLLFFSNIESIKYIRFHSRVPTVLPERIDRNFGEMINRLRPLFHQMTYVIHINHSDEISPFFESALRLLKRNMIVTTQSVLLKNINDNPETLSKLFLKLYSLGVMPHYLHHPDHAKGTTHFQLGLEEGRKIYFEMRKKLPGPAIPKYIIESPNGAGKIPAFNTDSFKFSGLFLREDSNFI